MANKGYINRIREGIEKKRKLLVGIEEELISDRYGLGEEPPYSLDAAAEKFDRSRRKIRRAETNALKTLGVLAINN